MSCLGRNDEINDEIIFPLFRTKLFFGRNDEIIFPLFPRTFLVKYILDLYIYI